MTHSEDDPDREVTRTGYGEEDEGGHGDPAETDEASPSSGEGGLDALHPADGSDRGCELCGGPVVERHCKIVCLNCGYQRDCSDP